MVLIRPFCRLPSSHGAPGANDVQEARPSSSPGFLAIPGSTPIPSSDICSRFPREGVLLPARSPTSALTPAPPTRFFPAPASAPQLEHKPLRAFFVYEPPPAVVRRPFIYTAGS